MQGSVQHLAGAFGHDTVEDIYRIIQTEPTPAIEVLTEYLLLRDNKYGSRQTSEDPSAPQLKEEAIYGWIKKLEFLKLLKNDEDPTLSTPVNPSSPRTREFHHNVVRGCIDEVQPRDVPRRIG
ncbi:uncharacterized protein N7496_012360 [Penicillium cataractarum]|uniref:Uncharacterized protein n=1 Tax=Penicillium cataractarum TaxID=2100454 RepID=A0A9W9URT6_9EURO|nr:uncharacterized protein N7496_012360 [Penicillium cataractarum]KAJ5355148.1 hypothetical protein N7496_012360 [Penicillium cataractarum]